MNGRLLPVVAQDPRFGGGVRTMTASFWRAQQELGNDPHLHYLSRAAGISPFRGWTSPAPRREEQPPFAGSAYPSIVPEFDPVNQLTGGRRIAARLRGARNLWVVAGGAPYGYGAALSGAPYAAYLATGIESEFHATLAELPPLRRARLQASLPLLRRLERLVLARASLLFAISPASRRTVADAAGVPVERVEILPIPVDLERLAPAPDEEWRRRLETEPTLVFLGRLADRRKNLDLLLGAFARVREQIPSARLRLAGEGPERSGSEPGVEWLGRVESTEQFLREGSIFVLPSLQEGFGIVVAEAMAAGLPAVVTPSGGPEGLVQDSGAGVVLGSFEAEELASTLLELIAAPDRLASMRQDGRAFVEREHSTERLREAVRAAQDELDARSGRDGA